MSSNVLEIQFPPDPSEVQIITGACPYHEVAKEVVPPHCIFEPRAKILAIRSRFFYNYLLLEVQDDFEIGIDNRVYKFKKGWRFLVSIPGHVLKVVNEEIGMDRLFLSYYAYDLIGGSQV